MEVDSHPLPEIYYFFLIARFFKPFSLFTIASFSLIIIVQSIYFLEMLDFGLILQYSMFHLGCLYIVTTNLLYRVVITRTLVFYFDKFQSMFLVDFGETSFKIKEKLSTTIKKLRITFITQIVVVLLNIFVSIYYWHNDGDELLAFLVILKRYLSTDSIIYTFIYFLIYLTYLMLTIPSLAIPLSYLYSIFYVKIQMLLLAEYINKLKVEFEKLAEERSKTKLYNTYVIMKLKLIIKKHLDIIRTHERILENQGEYLIYIFNGLFIGLSSVLGYFSPQISSLQAICLLLAYLVFGFSICDFGQDYLDASLDLAFELYDLDWYNWNAASQKIYLMLLTQFTKGMSISVLSVHTVSCELFKELSRILYTVASFLYSVKR